jgi:phosphoglycerate dehydrogenase-like enzyme
MRLLIYEPAYRRLKAELEAIAPGLEAVVMDDAGALSLDGAPISLDDAALDAAWTSTDLFGGPIRDFARAVLKSPGVKWMQSAAAGFDNPMFAQLVGRGVKLTTSHGQAVGMADYVIWGVLDHLQRGPERRAAQASGDWARLRYREIDGTRWLVIGFGEIGQGVGQRARAFGAHVTGVRRSGGSHPSADALAHPDGMLSLLPDADVVVLSAPLTPQTGNMVDAAFVAAMKPGSILVNVGRGGLVDEDALLAGLDAGKPEHAVLDVFQVEPLPADSRFWTHPRVTLTGHASGNAAGSSARNDRTFLENLRRYLAGEPLFYEAKAEDVIAPR